MGRRILIPRAAIDRLAAVGGNNGHRSGAWLTRRCSFPTAYEDAAVVVSAASRTLRRQLRALVWMTLEEVALDAVAEGDRLVARTSARQVAERLGVAPGTAAGALGVLRDRGLLVLEREQGPVGRFGLSVYVLGPLAGLAVVPPRAARHTWHRHRWGSRTWTVLIVGVWPGHRGRTTHGRATSAAVPAVPRPGDA